MIEVRSVVSCELLGLVPGHIPPGQTALRLPLKSSPGDAMERSIVLEVKEYREGWASWMALAADGIDLPVLKNIVGWRSV